MNSVMKNTFAAIVGAGWLFNLVAPAFISSYHSSLIANAPLMLVLGALWSTRGKDGS